MTYKVSTSDQMLATNVIHFTPILRAAGLPLCTRSTSVRPERSEGLIQVGPFAALRANGFGGHDLQSLNKCQRFRVARRANGIGFDDLQVSTSVQMLATHVIHFTLILRDAGLQLGTRSTSVRPERSEGFDPGRTLRCAQGKRIRV